MSTYKAIENPKVIKRAINSTNKYNTSIQSNYSLHANPKKLLIDLLLIPALRRIRLLIRAARLIINLLLRRRSRSINRYRRRINVHTPRLTNGHGINLLGLNDKDSIRKRFLALSTRQFVREDFDFDAEDTLAEEDVSSCRIDEITDLNKQAVRIVLT